MSTNELQELEPSVIDVVRDMLAERSISKPVSPNDNLSDLGLTSFDLVALVLSVESKFDVTIPESRITPASFRTVAAIDALVRSLRA